MRRTLKNLIFALIICVFLALIVFLCIVTYADIQSGEAKEYLVNTYDFKEKDVKLIKYNEYVYEDITDCDSLWFKKCTSEKELVFDYKFEVNDKTIIVKEFEDGSFTDDYGSGETNIEDLDSSVNITDTNQRIMNDILE